MTPIQTLHTYSILCGIAYSRSAEDQYKAMGYAPIQHINRKGIQAYVLIKDKQVLCVIRGSDEIRDWVRNINVNTINGVYAGIYTARTILIDSGVFNTPYNDTIIFMGHSLGGAIAHSFDPFPSISFGAPKILLGSDTHENAIRVTNCNDVAPKLPPNLKHARCRHIHLTYSGRIVENPSFKVRLSDGILGRLRAWRKGQIFTGFYDHSLELYQSKLSKI